MAMEQDRFWEIIETARTQNAMEQGDLQDLVDRLQDQLEQMEDEEVADFQRQMLVQYCRAFTYPLIGATYVIVGEDCDEDDLHGFRGWLIAQGREYFESTLQNPDSLADRPIVRNMVYLPDIISLGAEVYQESTGDLPAADPSFTLPAEPSGEEIPFEQLPKYLPDLCAEWSFESDAVEAEVETDPVAVLLAQVAGQVEQAEAENQASDAED